MITYYYMSGSVETKSVGIKEVDNDSYWLTELMDNKQYHVMMCAMNINGCGKQSSLIDFITPLSVPDPVSELKAERKDDSKSIAISWSADVTDQQILYYLITITSQDIISSYNFTISMITNNEMIYYVNVNEVELDKLDKCYEITVTVTAVNEMGNSTPEVFNITCDVAVNFVIGNISVSKDDGQLSTSMIITIAVPAAVLLILVILVVALSIYVLRRCRRYKQNDMEVGDDYNSKKRDSESSTVPLNYQRNDSIDTQDSMGSQLSTPRTVDSFMSEHMPFRMSTNGPLDPIQESPLPDERPRQPTPEDGRVMWTVGPAASNNDDIFDYDDEPRSPTTLDPTQPFIDDDDEQMIYTDNAAYFSVSHESNTKPATNYSGVKILSDNKNDGKEVVILPEKR